MPYTIYNNTLQIKSAITLLQYTLERRRVLKDRTHAGMDNKESGKCEHTDKGWVVFPNVVLSIDSQLLLSGLLHLYFSVKIAPVIIYLA